jgi:ERCC4-type nuclease
MPLRAAQQPIRTQPKRKVVRRPRARTAANEPGPGKPLVKRKSKRQPFDYSDVSVLIANDVGSKDLIEYPPFDKCGELCDLTSGDVCFIGNGPDGPVTVGVELKNVEDLVSSTDNGRLQGTQFRRMLTEYQVIWLLYYGRFRQAPLSNQLQLWKAGEWRNHYLGKRPVYFPRLTSLLISAQEIGVNTWHCEDKRQAVDWLAELVKWRIKPWEKHTSLQALDQSRTVNNKDKREKQANRASLMPVIDERTQLRAKVALQLPALGYHRALEVAERYSVKQMVNLTPDQWAELETVDRATGKRKKFGKGVGAAVVAAVNW